MGSDLGTPFPEFGSCFSVGTKKSHRYLPDLLEGHKVWLRDGRTAIWLGLKAAGVSPGDAVLVPSYHCPTMIAPVMWAGAEPIFYDLAPDDSLEPDLDNIEAAARAAGIIPKALLVPHYFGKPQPESILEKCCRIFPRSTLIEDCAHLAFVDESSQYVGRLASYVCFSIRKFFPVPDGGLLVGAGLERLKASVRRTFRGELRPVVRFLEGLSHRRIPVGNPRKRPPGRVGDRAAAGSGEASSPGNAEPMSMMARIAHWWMSEGGTARVENWTVYQEAFGSVSRDPPCRAVLRESPVVPYVYPLRILRDPDLVYLRLREAGVPVLRWDSTWPAMLKEPGSNRHRLAHEIIQLPCHQGLTKRQVQRIAERVLLEVRYAA